MRMHVALAVAALLVVGCTSGEDADSSASSGTTEAGTTDTTVDPAERGRAPGVTDDAIEVGITYVDLEAVRDVTNIDQGDFEGAYQALIDDINARGGIHGRTLEPVFAAVNPRGTQPADEVCLRLTEDEEVFVAVGFFLADAPLCYVETHDTAVIGGTMSAERLARAGAPWFALQGDDAQADSVRAMHEAGLLDGNVGLYGLAQDGDRMRESIEPLLDELGVDVTSTSVNDTPPDDVPASVAQGRVIAERFEADGVDTVVAIGEGAIGWLLALAQTDYRPQSLFTAQSTVLAYTSDEGNDRSVLDGAIQAEFYGPPTRSYNEPGMQDCLAILEDAGLEIPDPATVDDPDEQHFTSAANACQTMTLLEAVLDNAGEDLDYATFRTAAGSLGDLDMPGSPEPFHYGPPPSADGDQPIYLYQWDASDEDFVPLDD